jgi:hypothetical protein
MKKRNGDENEDEEPPPPRKMIKTVRGQERKYQFLMTVKSLDELDHIRFEVFCKINRSKLFVEKCKVSLAMDFSTNTFTWALLALVKAGK